MHRRPGGPAVQRRGGEIAQDTSSRSKFYRLHCMQVNLTGGLSAGLMGKKRSENDGAGVLRGGEWISEIRRRPLYPATLQFI